MLSLDEVQRSSSTPFSITVNCIVYLVPWNSHRSSIRTFYFNHIPGLRASFPSCRCRVPRFEIDENITSKNLNATSTAPNDQMGVVWRKSWSSENRARSRVLVVYVNWTSVCVKIRCRDVVFVSPRNSSAYLIFLPLVRLSAKQINIYCFAKN